MATNPPYLASPGTLTTALNKIKEAKTPDRFTYDFVSNVLQLKGGTARALPPFFKRVGFLNPDGSPSTLYERFRNDSTSEAAAAEALRIGYSSIFEVNESAHQLHDKDLKGIIIQVTGAEKESSTVDKTLRTFKNLRAFANPDAIGQDTPARDAQPNGRGFEDTKGPVATQLHSGYPLTPQPNIGLNYTINIQLPATTNIEVFNAIFRSLREHLLDR